MKNSTIVNEILDFAIRNEDKAVEFYTELADKMNNPTMRQVFVDFAAEERSHKKLLGDLKAGKNVKLDTNQAVDLKIADFTVKVQPTADMDYQAALVLAMQKEKKAFRLYSTLADLVNNSEAKNLFKSLAQQEARHKLRFELEYDEVVLKDD